MSGDTVTKRVPRALLVGRHRLFRECLADRLEARGSLEVAGQVDLLGAVPDRVEEDQVGLILVDLSCGQDESEEQLRRLTADPSSPRVVILGLSGQREDYLRWVEAGASGYVLQESSLTELETALDRVLAGEVYCSPRVTYSLFDRVGELTRRQRRKHLAESMDLTPREMEVLRLIADGLTNRQIAERIHLSVYTVKNHVHNILGKLNVGGRMEAVEKAFERHWLHERRRSATP